MREFVHVNNSTLKSMRTKKCCEILPYEKDEIRDSIAGLLDAMMQWKAIKDMGQWIRNEFGLWHGYFKLVEACGAGQSHVLTIHLWYQQFHDLI